MLSIIVAMVLILVLSGLVITYVAFPHRGHDVPNVPWLGTAMSRAAERAPVLKDDEGDETRSDLLRR